MRDKERAREMKEVERWRAAWCAREGGRDAGARENERAREGSMLQ